MTKYKKGEYILVWNLFSVCKIIDVIERNGVVYSLWVQSGNIDFPIACDQYGGFYYRDENGDKKKTRVSKVFNIIFLLVVILSIFSIILLT